MNDTPLMLSISGARGIVGRSLTPPDAARFAAAFAAAVRDLDPRAGADGPLHVVVGRDSRPSGEMLEMAAVSGLLSMGCQVTRLGIVSTPGVAVMVDELGADAGLVVTASHNPPAWNGLKPLLRGGGAPPAPEAERIIERFRGGDLDYVDAQSLHACRYRDDADRVHAERIVRCVDREAIRNAGIKVAVDSIHGAGGREVLALLHALGVSVYRYFHFHPEPTGRFPRGPEPTPENLAEFCAELPAYNVDVAFVQDPDADRLALIDENARCIGEEYTLALCAMHKLGNGDTVVTNLSTSRMIDDIAAEAGARVVRTPVGEANVAAAMRAERAVIGGEGNGGVILPAVSPVRDSLAGIALILELLAQRKQPLSRIVEQLPAYAMVKDKAPADEGIIARLGEVLSAQYREQTVDQQDGVRVDWPDRWVHVRPSNTEPIVRFIAEARDQTQAAELIAGAKQTLGIDGPS